MIEKQLDVVLQLDGHPVPRATGMCYRRKKRVTRNGVEQIAI
jgi:hypothetical protein